MKDTKWKKVYWIMKPGTAKLRSVLLLIGLLFSNYSFSQLVIKAFSSTSFTNSDYALIKQSVGINKEIPLQYEKQILIALTYFPELINTAIEFRIRNKHTPLSSRPSWVSIARRNESRKYIITISDSSEGSLMHILLKNMNFNAQVGVIGHELSHVSDFITKNSLGLMRIGLGNLSQKFLDRFEYRTDSICIAHG